MAMRPGRNVGETTAASVQSPRSRWTTLILNGTEFGIPSWAMWLIAVGPPVFWALSVGFGRCCSETFYLLTGEDGPVEYAQVVVLCLGAVIAARLAISFRRRETSRWAFVYGILTIGLAIVAGEEISWGQRILGLETPEWLSAQNVQKETNLHNLPHVMRTMHDLTNLILIAVIPLSLYVWVWRRNLIRALSADRWIPHPILIPTWLSFLSYSAMRPAGLIGSRDQEPSELILFTGVTIFLCMVYAYQKRSNKTS